MLGNLQEYCREESTSKCVSGFNLGFREEKIDDHGGKKYHDEGYYITQDKTGDQTDPQFRKR